MFVANLSYGRKKGREPKIDFPLGKPGPSGVFIPLLKTEPVLPYVVLDIGLGVKY